MNEKNEKNSLMKNNDIDINININPHDYLEINSFNNLDNLDNLDNLKFKKICFIFNAIQDGWSVKKKDNSYIFSKKHEGKKEVYLDTYLQTFIKKNINKPF